MPQPLILPMPPGLQIIGDYILRLNAIDPATGDSVAGVNVSNITFQVDLISAGSTDTIGALLLGREAGT